MWVALVMTDVVRQTVCINAVSGVGVRRENYRNTPCKEMSEVLNAYTGGTYNNHRDLEG